MDSEKPFVDPIALVEHELRAAKSAWLSFEFPYYVTTLYGENGKAQVVIGRIRSDIGTAYCIPVYSSMKAKERSSMWKQGDRPEDIAFIKVVGLAEAYHFWHGVLLRFFQLIPGLTEQNAHDLVIWFDHADGKPLPYPVCAFCYVLSLQATCKKAGIRLALPKTQEGTIQGGLKDVLPGEETSDTLDIDME